MDNYPRLFIRASVVYLTLGIVLGIAMGLAPDHAGQIRFIHIHFNLMGFMTMFVAGVAYHVLPRFSGRALPWPGGVKYHFWLHNVGLVGLLSSYAIGGGYHHPGPFRVAFILCAVMTASGMLIMAYNIFFILSKDAPESSR
ncbi:MAG: cbb3-type cytochrome c oxidase subunit I [Candidatus Nitrohelix vancouverensis]|uniref:Cbb3-type cytochrome c oxidase subunit I n=1 Tax=Candidatus Nitrohelix vancouverensis TaxID=2705534 RepID=A0A7T0C4F6_9BACT|nr:MAG: cbb3-type cytochrome c oxidase subunit I [Candidatus Nitrohelix vancouverensis]